MTPTQLTLSFGIPRQTIYNWRNSSPSDWRYKLYIFLTSNEVSPKEVERALTQAPETQENKGTIATLIEQIKTLQTEVQALQGASDAKLRSKSGEV